MKKNIVIDTNVIIHDPESILKFEDNDVYIPIYVIEEVDQFKRESTERGRNCRHFTRLLSDLRFGSNQTLSDGVPMGDGRGTLTVFLPAGHDNLRSSDHGAMDRAILDAAVEIRNRSENKTVFVTMDTNLRIRADAIGMTAETYENSHTEIESHSSVVEIDVSKEDIDNFFTQGRSAVGISDSLRPNASILYRGPNSTALGRYDAKTGEVRQLKIPREGVMGIRPKNKEQAFALDLLLDDEIQLVTLVGLAGSGKTLLAIAAGLHKITNESQYVKMLVSRPVMPLGKDIGFLPGSVDEKMNPWMQPIFDNLEFLSTQGKIRDKNENSYTDLIESGLVQIEPLTYIRGRSLPRQFLLVDETQNLSHHEIRTVITRVGEGSKIILTGDPEQIDNPYVDATSNGLSVVTDRFRDQTLAGHVTLTKGERSKLAELATKLLR